MRQTEIGCRCAGKLVAVSFEQRNVGEQIATR
jgi:hypothetical protein